MPADIKAALEEIAALEDRSVSSLMRQLAEQRAGRAMAREAR